MIDGQSRVGRGLWPRVRRRLWRARLRVPAALRRQRGAGLLILMGLVVVGSTAALLEHAGSEAQYRATSNESTTQALSRAKEALIAWAVTFPAQGLPGTAPGQLPFPDSDADGKSDCPAGAISDADLIGRFPVRGHVDGNCDAVPLGISDIRDGSGERLWYAVSRNLLKGGDGGPINPDMGDPSRVAHPWLKVIGPDGQPLKDASGLDLKIAAVIIAPGGVLTGQSRAGAATADNYLDSIDIGGTDFDNADMDGCPDNLAAPCGGLGEEFVSIATPGPDSDFNDKMVYITVDELLRAVEKRVLGEASIALEGYRTATPWNVDAFNPFSQGVYPWLADFRNTWGVVSGVVTATPAGQFQSTFDFTAAGVRRGDIIVKINDPDDPLDDARGMVESVDGGFPNRINFAGLYNSESATSETFSIFDEFVILPSYAGEAGVREGSLPVHQRDQFFATGFTATWDFGSPTTATIATNDSGADSDADLIAGTDLVPPAVEASYGDTYLESNTITLNESDARCMWKDVATQVRCYATTSFAHVRSDIAGSPTVTRTIEYSFSFNGPSATLTQPTATAPRTRLVWASPLERLATETAPVLPFADWMVRITDTLGTDWGARFITIDNGVTAGSLQLSGIRYDLGVDFSAADSGEIPQWFVENGWHEYLYAALSGDGVAVGGANGDADNDCTTPANDCLVVRIGGTPVRTDVRALLVSAGVQWDTQGRGNADCDGDSAGPDGVALGYGNDFLCAFLEGDSMDRIGTPDVFSRDLYSSTNNDQLRVVSPLPP